MSNTYKVYAEWQGQTFSKKVLAESPDQALDMARTNLGGYKGAKLTVTPEHGAGLYGIALAKGAV